jgi:hypothetical protein
VEGDARLLCRSKHSVRLASPSGPIGKHYMHRIAKIPIKNDLDLPEQLKPFKKVSMMFFVADS